MPPLDWIVVGGVVGGVAAVAFSVARSFGLFLLHGKRDSPVCM